MPHARTTPLILVADDERHIRAVVASKLRTAGYEVMEAGDGAEAFALATATPPDAVVTDLQMPEMSGIELCMALKAEPSCAQVPCLLLTARGYILNDDQVARTNIRMVMSKPFSAREVIERVASFLGAAPTAETYREGLGEAA